MALRRGVGRWKARWKGNNKSADIETQLKIFGYMP